MLPKELELQVVTPERHILAHTVDAVEVPGKEGYLGVLPGHAPLITELGAGILAYRKDGVSKFLTVMGGYAEVLPDRVIVLAEVSEKVEEIDRNRAQAAQQRAQTELTKASAGSEEWYRASGALDRALVRMQALSRTGGASPD